MKNILLVFLAINSGFIFAQNDSTKFKDDTISQKYLGVNIGSIMTGITQYNVYSMNYSLKFKVEKKNNLIYQSSLNLKSENSKKETFNNFTDTLNNIHTLSYSKYSDQFDLRIGIGIYEKLGYGKIYLVGDLILGYTEVNQNYDDFVQYINNNAVEGYGFEPFEIAEANYFTTGIDFSIGYEINLAKRLMLSIEYVPEISFNSLLNTDYYSNNKDNVITFNTYTMNTYFNVLNVNLFYHF